MLRTMVCRSRYMRMCTLISGGRSGKGEDSSWSGMRASMAPRAGRAADDRLLRQRDVAPQSTRTARSTPAPSALPPEGRGRTFTCCQSRFGSARRPPMFRKSVMSAQGRAERYSCPRRSRRP